MKKAFVVDLSKESQRILATYYTDHSTSNQANEVARKIYELIKKAKHSNNDIALNHNEIKKAFFNPFMPQLKNAQVFLSHSHRDEKQVLKVKNYLESNTNCKVFVDSLFWDYKDEILNEIAEYDDDISEIEDAFTLILRESLEIMIQKCPYFVFLQSKNSISYQGLSSITYSAWIYEELKIVNAFLQKPRITAMRVSHNITELLKGFETISLDNLCELIIKK
ncbi:toll/interleukin-1 receptor domain-containing protein [Helicobacter cetorum]|uniref:TIR domain-containing protein n=1 Tax=Helicobacter cetorum (strain ATCC BAA-429 / MIT 00-7128) TaxID=182217 RepID=I0EKE1_HELC0|nr:toll/interleukin-1 receptor domain-containing protein [Helicobacter cetorum]AFI03410.1 hypothetical protein HCW_00575 [Helicobacter cetorum MIT 00-7128]